MKKILIVFLCLFIVNVSFSESKSEYKEKIILTIDRNLYVIDEAIHFSAQLLSQKDSLSRVLYIELITPSGKQISGAKFKIVKNKSTGYIKIPVNINTGNYYLRAYTKNMRNYGPQSYNYQFIKIVNPYKKDILNNSSADDSSKFVFNEYENNNKFLKLSLNKNIAGSRENLKISIKKLGNDSLINAIILISPQAASNFKQLNFKYTQGNEMHFFPETRGVSLTGLLKDKSLDSLLQRKVINLTILGSKYLKLYSTYTNLNGRFFFSLPDFTGDKDIFISSEKNNNTDPVLLIDNDFCTQNISLPNPPFSLTKKERQTVYDMAINKEVYKHFTTDSVQKPVAREARTKDTLPFYGLPTHTLVLDNYIPLPTLEDYFTELSFIVKIKKEKDQKQFKIIGTHHDLTIFEPLIMVDLIPIYNINHILEIPPKKIARIEVINEPFVKGDLKYGGIIHFISVNNDFGGVKLPDSGIFLNYSFYHKHPKLPTIPNLEKYPDPRNTLYWNPELKLNTNKEVEIHFRTGDTKGPYRVSVIGITTSGKKLYSTVNFEVK